MADTEGSPHILHEGARVDRKRVGVLIIHGIGTGATGYSEKFRTRLKKMLKRQHKISEPHDVCFEEVFWGSVAKSSQSEIDLNNNVFMDRDVKRKRLRSFVLRSLADAAMYQDIDRERRQTSLKWLEEARGYPLNAGEITFERVNGAVSKSLANLASRLAPDAPLIVVAHSFGGHVANSYIAAAQRGVIPRAPTPLERCETLAGVITFGCNIPAFVFSADACEVVPIEVPGRELKAFKREIRQADLKPWQNFFHPRDVLGYPLGTINEDYRRIVEDIPTRFPTLPWQFDTPHTGYWKSPTVLELTAGYIYLARYYGEPEHAQKISAQMARLQKLAAKDRQSPPPSKTPAYILETAPA